MKTHARHKPYGVLTEIGFAIIGRLISDAYTNIRPYM